MLFFELEFINIADLAFAINYYWESKKLESSYFAFSTVLYLIYISESFYFSHKLLFFNILIEFLFFIYFKCKTYIYYFNDSI